MPREALIQALPHRRMEAWKWTDMRAAAPGNLAAFDLAGAPLISLPEGANLLQINAPAGEQPMQKLAASVEDSVHEIEIPAGFAANEPLNLVVGNGHTRIRVRIGAGASLSTMETYDGGAGGFINADITFDLAEGAKLNRHILQTGNASAITHALASINMWGKCGYVQAALAFGGMLSRLETRIAVLGSGCEIQMGGAYLLEGERHADMTSVIDLTAPDCEVRQVVKGAAYDKARGVFQGKFLVRRPAQRTDAEMRHDGLLISDRAQVRAKPELEIYADDVACAHGNTVGQLDDDILFYMRQRGIPEKQAHAILTEAFVRSAFDGMDADSLIGKIAEWLSER